MNDHALRLQRLCDLVDSGLEKILDVAARTSPEPLAGAMRYAVFPGGKRIRPALLLEACRISGGKEEDALPAACAVELVHSYSLLHDDLPCMDDAATRRGKPSVHVVFGEAVAVLAGDALLTLAFEVLSGEMLKTRSEAESRSLAEAMWCIARNAGPAGMVGGQAEEIHRESEPRSEDEDWCKRVIERKTAALFECSLRAGALIGGGRRDIVEVLTRFGKHLGIVFQVADDIADLEEDSVSYAALAGANKARSYAEAEAKAAFECLLALGKKGGFLRAVLDDLVERLARRG